MITLTKEDVIKVYDELDRRMEIDTEDMMDIPNFNINRWIWDERASRLQGVYGTIMALVPNRNWQDIVYWKNQIEEERYGRRVW